MLKEFVLQRYKKESHFYEKEMLPDGKNHWPRDKVPGEEAYEKFFNYVSDPVTKQFYKGKREIPQFNEDGTPKIDPDTGVAVVDYEELEPRRKVTQIVRIKTEGGKEYLYSIGQIVAYSQFGDETIGKYREPELYIETTFKHVTKLDPKDNRYKPMTDGPSGTITHYEMPFNKENLEKLWQDAVVGCVLCVKDERSQAVKQCPDYDTFLNKSFDYIMEMDYLTEEQKKQKQKEFEKEQAALIKGSKK